jgi:hypothetical protein
MAVVIEERESKIDTPGRWHYINGETGWKAASP